VPWKAKGTRHNTIGCTRQVQFHSHQGDPDEPQEPIKALDPVTALWVGPWHTQFLSHLASLHTQAVCPPLFPPPPQTYKKDANV
jgi:hypothetical protein